MNALDKLLEILDSGIDKSLLAEPKIVEEKVKKPRKPRKSKDAKGIVVKNQIIEDLKVGDIYFPAFDKKFTMIGLQKSNSGWAGSEVTLMTIRSPNIKKLDEYHDLMNGAKSSYAIARFRSGYVEYGDIYIQEMRLQSYIEGSVLMEVVILIQTTKTLENEDEVSVWLEKKTKDE